MINFKIMKAIKYNEKNIRKALKQKLKIFNKIEYLFWKFIWNL